MRNFQLEAAIWSLFASKDFFNIAARECDEAKKWLGSLAILRNATSFGRNNQIFDKLNQWAGDFRRGGDLAAFEDYRLVWDTAGVAIGDVRGILEQPLRGWMADDEYEEFCDDRIGKIVTISESIYRALNNAMVGADCFYSPDPDDPEALNIDGGFSGADIVEWYEDLVKTQGIEFHCPLPDPLPDYVVNKSVTCKTGDEVPQTGVWYPATGLEHHSLTFAVKGARMQPGYRIVKTTEQLSTPEWMFPPPETIAVPTVWHLVMIAERAVKSDDELRAKAGQACPKTGLWQPTDPGAQTRHYNAGDKMLSLGSAHGLTVWRWLADR